jgi:hypothetical protein
MVDCFFVPAKKNHIEETRPLPDQPRPVEVVIGIIHEHHIIYQRTARERTSGYAFGSSCQ